MPARAQNTDHLDLCVTAEAKARWERAGQMSRRSLVAVHLLGEQAIGAISGSYTLSNYTIGRD